MSTPNQTPEGLPEIRKRLLSANHKTTSALVIDKTQCALNKLKMAQRLIDEARGTLEWAEHRIANPIPRER